MLEANNIDTLVKKKWVLEPVLKYLSTYMTSTLVPFLLTWQHQEN